MKCIGRKTDMDGVNEKNEVFELEKGMTEEDVVYVMNEEREMGGMRWIR